MVSKYLTAISACFVMSLSFANAEDVNNGRAAEFMKAIVAQDIIFDLSALQTVNNALFSLPDEPKLNYAVSAVEVARSFVSNPSQADQKYSNAVFDVTGQINAVKNDDAGKAYVVFETSSNPAQNTIAYLSPKGAQKAESYKNGQILKLRCNGASLSTVVTLKDCREMPPVVEEATKIADKAVDMFLKGENIEKILVTNSDKPASHSLFFLMYIGKNFKLNDDCFSRETIRKCDFTKYNVNQITRSDEYKKAYEDKKAFYHLP